MLKTIAPLTISMTTFLTSGCDTDDQRLAKLATDSAEQQARQSERMAEAHANLTDGARQLVESAGRSQESLVTIQHGLEKQQAEIGHQRDLLEKDRQVIAWQRHTDPIIASAIVQAAVLLACVLPLVLCWILLRRPATTDTDGLLTEILIEENTADQPLLLPGPISNQANRPAGLPPPGQAPF
jgi:hypothetical protein